ncbi:hypothetical protein FGG08_003478 [Glutinoglossum americanum]|uniref:CSN8/PSMD8/EIF3K domain-containing protein n=1 Tax=Glutinoglossum americanum TaxID=1670608 RepID=A0A9P8HY83_9PEZI|nr:hypothetical protein FGG08_003478 [Glutinoglossum americanum]
MSNADLTAILKRIHTCLSHHDYTTASTLLTRAKLALLSLNALVPAPTTPQPILALARETLELGALTSIRQQDPEGFTRYVQQLQPFYDLPSTRLPCAGGNKSKITGLYLLLLLSQGDYAGFHTLLEALEVSEDAHKLEEDVFIQYPVKLEQWLMEGSYDKVWGATKGERVPSEEYGVFSEVGLISLTGRRWHSEEGGRHYPTESPWLVLVGTIRAEIASCSEKAYTSLPISNAKNLLFLDSEGSVIAFAEARGWVVSDGRIRFPLQQEQGARTEKEILVASGTVIENTIGYARELETIV